MTKKPFVPKAAGLKTFTLYKEIFLDGPNESDYKR